MGELLGVAGYSTIGLTVPTGLLQDRTDSLRREFDLSGIDTVMRADFSPTSRVELLRVLRRFRNRYDIVAVKCLNQRVATVACRDRRVDIIFFDAVNRSVRFTHSFARLLHGAIEFNVVSDLTEQPNGWAFSRIRKALRIASEHRVKVVLSSGARNHTMVRSPLEISALATVLGLREDESIKSVSSVPSSIVAENRKKRSPKYVEEGVTIVVPPGR
jgi:RNase P/RNase MRP subunit p30